VKTTNYDINTYVFDGIVKLIPYELYLYNGELCLDASTEVSPYYLELEMSNPAHRDAIAFALNTLNDEWDNPNSLLYEEWRDEEWSDEGHYSGVPAFIIRYWDELDEWSSGNPFWTAPEPISSWMKTLPWYEVEVRG
jgi:hypothetical protein